MKHWIKIPLIAAIILPAFSNTVPMITNVRLSRTDSTIVIEYDLFDRDGDSTTLRLAFGGQEIDLGDSGVVVSKGRIVLPKGLVDNPNLPPHLLEFDGTGWGGEYIEVSPAERARAMLSRFEITNLEFAAFIEAGGYETEDYWIVDDGSITRPRLGREYQGKFRWLTPEGWRFRDDPPWKSDTISSGPFYPVVGVSWWECWAYCKWAGLHLPSDNEWDAAARLACGNSDVILPKGNFAGEKDPFAELAPTGSFPSKNFADIAGNVWEWLEDVRDVIDYVKFSCATRDLAGGSWLSPPDNFPKYRSSACPLLRRIDVGFRPARNQ